MGLGLAIGGGALMAAGGAGGIMSGIMGSDAQKKAAQDQMKLVTRMAESSAAERKSISDQARADQGIATQNLMASEQAKLNVLQSLGAPGTYGPSPGSTSGPISLGILSPTSMSGGPGGGPLMGTKTVSGTVTGKDVALGAAPRWQGEKSWSIMGADLDPSKMAAAVEGTSGFRTVSGMVAEAEQLMNRSGPLWNQLNNSVVGQIYASNAANSRAAMNTMSQLIARGGTARRAGLQMAQAFQLQEQTNRDRTNQLWQAKLSLEQFRSTYAQGVTDFANSWVNNTAGIRDSFTTALNNLQLNWTDKLAPELVGASVNAGNATMQGMMNASAGLQHAVQTRYNSIQGAFDSLMGIGQSAMGAGIGAAGGLTNLFQGAKPLPSDYTQQQPVTATAVYPATANY